MNEIGKITEFAKLDYTKRFNRYQFIDAAEV